MKTLVALAILASSPSAFAEEPQCRTGATVAGCYCQLYTTGSSFEYYIMHGDMHLAIAKKSHKLPLEALAACRADLGSLTACHR